MINDVFAPIIIPTCNRIGHLRNLIDSIRKNKESKFTDIYISVDFPPSKKYYEGYKEVLEYVNFLKNGNDFNELILYVQENNLGPIGNALFLMKEVRRKHSIWIFTEDDNIMANNTLQFINGCLERYYEDKRFFSVCAHNPNGADVNQSKIVAHSYFAPYVVAYWGDKYDEMDNWINRDNIINLSTDFGKMVKLRKYNPSIFNLLVNGYLCSRKNRMYSFENGEPTPIDVYRNIYCLFNDKKALYPSMNLVFNAGRDGSGVNSKKDDEQSPIIHVYDFECTDFDNVYIDDSSASFNKIHGFWAFMRDKKPIITYLKWYLSFCIFGKRK